jgi:hypothetical protein
LVPTLFFVGAIKSQIKKEPKLKLHLRENLTNDSMMRHKYVYNRIESFNNKETIPSIIDVSHVFAALFYIYLALPNSTHSI